MSGHLVGEQAGPQGGRLGRAAGYVGRVPGGWGEPSKARFVENAQLPGDWPVHETTRLGKQRVRQAWTLVQEPGGWRRGLEVGILMGRVPAGGMEIGRPGEPPGRQVQTERTAPASWRRSGEAGAPPGVVDRVIPRSPVLAEGCGRLRTAYARWTLLKDSLLAQIKKVELRGPWLCKPHTPRRGAGS